MDRSKRGVILSPVIDAYREWLYSAGLKPKTVTAYVQKIRQVTAWCHANRLDLTSLKPSQLAQITELTPPQSRRQLRSAIRHYWSMLGVEGPIKAIRVPPKPRSRWRGLEAEDAVKLLQVARAHAPRGGIVIVGLYLAIRREEIVTLRWDHFDRDLNWVTITGKFDVQRPLPVHPRLRAYLRANRWDNHWLFPGRFGGHIAAGTMNLWLDELAEEAGIGHVHPHQLRHTSLNRISRLVGIDTAQTFAGHIHIESTRIYTTTDHNQLLAGMAALDAYEDLYRVADDGSAA